MTFTGYASADSVIQGGTVNFFASKDPPAGAALNVYRVGLTDQLVYSTNIASIPYQAPGPQPGDSDLPIRIVSYNWASVYVLAVPTAWVSGLYRAEFSAGEVLKIYFVVRSANPGATSSVLLQFSTTTLHAYNPEGGRSLYEKVATSDYNLRARRVTLDRPISFPAFAEVYKHEVAFLRWAEYKQIPIECCTGLDLHADSTLVSHYQLFLSLGHDEYWSREMRDQIEAFIANGGNTAFLSGNVCWWQARFEDNNRTIVCYREKAEDPLTGSDNSRVTVNWFDDPVYRPENHMTGVSFRGGAGYWQTCTQPRVRAFAVRFADHWVFEGTGLRDNVDTFASGYVGYETDAAQFAYVGGLPPAGIPRVTGQDGTPLTFVVIADADMTDWTDCGQAGWATMGLFDGGGSVFTAATIDWALGLIPPNASPPTPVHQITWNVVNKLKTPIPPYEWEVIGKAYQVVGMAGSDGLSKLFAATNDNILWWRDAVAQNLKWVQISTANGVVAMAGADANNKLFAATSDNKLWWRDASGQDLPWQQIGSAYGVKGLALWNGKLYAATSDNVLWWRDAIGSDVPWVQIGHANNVVAMTAAVGKLFAVTSDNTLWWRDPVGYDVPWDQIGTANSVVAMAAAVGKIVGATSDSKLWWRNPVPGP